MKQYKYSEQLNFLTQFFEEKKTKIKVEDEDEDFTGDNDVSEAVSSENKIIPDCITEIKNVTNVKSKNQNSSDSKPTTDSIEHFIPRKKAKQSIRKKQPPKISAATITEYIVQRNEKTVSPLPLQHPVDAFLSGIAPALKNLPPEEWHYAKGEIFATVQKFELQMLTNQQVVQPDPISTYSCDQQISPEKKL